MIQIAIQKGGFHKDVNTGIISVLHKKGKDPKFCSNWLYHLLIATLNCMSQDSTADAGPPGPNGFC